MEEIIRKRINESIAIKESLLKDEDMLAKISALAADIAYCIKNSGKILVCGNGGSASDALHMVGEIVGRFQKERRPWAAISLNSDVATMTAIANDYDYNEIYARQVKALMNCNDIVLGISTSGNSQNIYNAIIQAKCLGGKTAALLGRDGGKIKKEVDYPIIVSSDVTARIQETHITIIHIICEILENKLVEDN